MVKISQLMKVIIEQESAIILERGGNRVFAGNKQELNVRFVAPLDGRVKNIAALRKISTVDAERLIQTTDEEREEFHKTFSTKISTLLQLRRLLQHFIVDPGEHLQNDWSDER